MFNYLKLYSISVVIFFAIDLIWLGLVAKGFYQKYLGFILREQPHWPVAIGFYLIYVAGMVYFVIEPAISAESWRKACVAGAIFGFVTYATYDLTNHATLKDWPWQVTIADICWGTCLGCFVSTASYFANRMVGLGT